ncbi:MAG: AAA family ATPase, partial [Desulfosalsimonas sp.]
MDHDIKSLFSKLNSQSTNVLHNAVGLCVSRTNYEITVEQFLLKSLEDTSGDIQVILRHFEIDPARLTSALTDALEDQKAGNPGKPTFSPLLVELFEKAWMITSIDFGSKRIRTGVILMAFLNKPAYFGGGPYTDMLKKINTETLQKDFRKITEGSTEQETAGSPEAAGEDAGQTASGDGFLAKYCQDFTAKAASGDIDPVFGREDEIHQIIDVLARRRKNNPILVGEPGVGKTAVIEGLALRITEEDVPDMLKNVTLLGLDMGALEAGAGMKGEFENRLKGVLNDIKASEKPIILFIDEAHTLIGAGGSAGSSDAANLLKPALARGEIKTCAATTWSEYKKYFEKDPALARRFQLIKLAEPDVSVATLILRGLKENYETSHKVIVRDDAIVAAAEYADRYISGRFLPDKAIDLLDTSCARIKINLTAKPPVLTDAERARQALEREKRAIERDRDHGIA